MPTLVCRICGRIVYTTAPLDHLFAEEQRCPRCGGPLFDERRTQKRRGHVRRQEGPDAAGPPDGVERRVSDRRVTKRRRDDRGSFTV